MKSSVLENKTVRPGLMYSYASDRHPFSQAQAPVVKTQRRKHRFLLPFLIILIAAGAVGYALKPASKVEPSSANKVASSAAAPAPKKTVSAAPAATATSTAVNHCAGNTLSRQIMVSISARHLWACNGTTSVYDTPVVTGIEYLAADKTPVGTYHIYGKYTNQTLKGCDTTGCWNDPVSYWMPFLHNQYGSYGLHDATWRANNDFGNISPNSSDASHGCVELPLGAAQYLYGWASIGTTVTIQS